MSPHFVLGRENVPCITEVVNRSLKADCTDFTKIGLSNPNRYDKYLTILPYKNLRTSGNARMRFYLGGGGRFVDFIPGRINYESLVFGPIIFVDAFHPMIVPIVQAKLSS